MFWGALINQVISCSIPQGVKKLMVLHSFFWPKLEDSIRKGEDLSAIRKSKVKWSYCNCVNVTDITVLIICYICLILYRIITVSCRYGFFCINVTCNDDSNNNNKNNNIYLFQFEIIKQLY